MNADPEHLADTVTALELLCGVLLESFATEHPATAERCATELAGLRDRLPRQLPASADAVGLKLMAWESILSTQQAQQWRLTDPLQEIG